MRCLMALCLVAMVAAGVGCKGRTGDAVVQAVEASAAGVGAAQGKGFVPQRRKAQKGAAVGVFDFYLLTLSWSPEYCATHQTDPECAPRTGGPYGFLVHGLWPENADGTYPENCSNAAGPKNPGQYSDIIPDASLVMHEWTTHGTCSGLGPDAYFALVRKAFQSVKIPAQFLGTKQPAMLAPKTIISEFAMANPGFPQGSEALSCGNNRLTAMEFCLSKGLAAMSCSGIKSCGATQVKITAR